MKPSIRFFFDHLSDGLLVLNGLGVVRYANPASQTVLASQLDPVALRGLSRAISRFDFDAALALCQQVQQGQHPGGPAGRNTPTP